MYFQKTNKMRFVWGIKLWKLDAILGPININVCKINIADYLLYMNLKKQWYNILVYLYFYKYFHNEDPVLR